MPVRGIGPSTAAGVLEGLVVRVDLAGLGVVLTGLLELGGEVLLCAEHRVERVHVEVLRRRFALLGDELVDPGGELGHDSLGLHLVDDAVLAHLQDPVLLLEYLADQALIGPVRLGLILGLPRFLVLGLLGGPPSVGDLVVDAVDVGVGVVVPDVFVLLGSLIEGLLDPLAFPFRRGLPVGLLLGVALDLAHVDPIMGLLCGRSFAFAPLHLGNVAAPAQALGAV